MSASAETLLRQALKLPPSDRAALVEGLITSLDKPDPELDALWLKEAESRMAPIAQVNLMQWTRIKFSLSLTGNFENNVLASCSP